MKNAFFLLLIFLVLFSVNALGARIIDENADNEVINTTVNSGFGILAQGFIVDSNTYAVAVQIPINNQGVGGDFNVSIWDANSGGFPNAPLSGCTDLNSSAVPNYPNTNYTDFNFVFNTGCLLGADTNYFIVARSDPINGIWFLTSADIYSKGFVFSAADINGQTGWARDVNPNRDLFFRLWTDDANNFQANFTATKIRDLNTLAPIADRNGVYDFNFTGGLGQKTFLDANWFVSGVRKKTVTSFANINFHYEGFATPGDYNISLVLKATDGNVSQKDLTLTIIDLGTGPMNINISQTGIGYSSLGGADVNFTVTFDGNVNYFVWGGFQDGNRTGQTVNGDFNAQGKYNICVTLNSIGDFNTVYCENFYLSNGIIKIPKNEETLANITPYNASLDTTPFQTYSGISADQNFWVFHDANGFNLFFVDANSSFFGRSYIFDFNTSGNFQQIIQPFLSTVSSGIDVIFITVNAFDFTSLQDVRITSSRPSAGGIIIIEQETTDSTGQATLTFIPELDYSLLFQLNDFNYMATYVPNAADTVKTALLDVNGFPTADVNQGLVDINVLQQGQVNVVNGFVDFNARITPIGSTKITAIIFTVEQNGTIFASINYTTGVTNGGLYGITANVSTANFSLPIDLNITVMTNSTPQGHSSLSSFLLGVSELVKAIGSGNSDLGRQGAGLLAIFIIGIALAGFSLNFSQVVGSNENLLFIAIPLMFVFMYFGWLGGNYWFDVLLGITGGVFFYARRKDIGG